MDRTIHLQGNPLPTLIRQGRQDPGTKLARGGKAPRRPWKERERLKSILEEATKPSDGASPLIETNPFMLPIPPDPQPESWRIRPVDGKTLRMRYVATPAYTRIAIYLSALAGGEAGDFLKHDRQSADATRFCVGRQSCGWDPRDGDGN